MKIVPDDLVPFLHHCCEFVLDIHDQQDRVFLIEHKSIHCHNAIFLLFSIRDIISWPDQHPAGRYTPQEPPSYPMETLSSATTTGTFLTPFENFSISSSFELSNFTSKYWAFAP
jgi:hypothetical protein